MNKVWVSHLISGMSRLILEKTYRLCFSHTSSTATIIHDFQFQGCKSSVTWLLWNFFCSKKNRSSGCMLVNLRDDTPIVLAGTIFVKSKNQHCWMPTPQWFYLFFLERQLGRPWTETWMVSDLSCQTSKKFMSPCIQLLSRFDYSVIQERHPSHLSHPPYEGVAPQHTHLYTASNDKPLHEFLISIVILFRFRKLKIWQHC